MRYVQTTLFGHLKVNPRKTANQSEFEINHQHLLRAFPSFVDRAFVRLNEEIYANVEPESRNKNLPATAISGYLQGEIIRNFPDYCTFATKKRFKIKFEGSEWIYVKKLNHKKLPSNIKTNANDMIINQVSDSNSDKEPNVFLGYRADASNTAATEIYAVYLLDNKVIWYTDLRDFADKINITNKNVQLPTGGQQIEINSDVVTIKRKAGNK